MKISLSVDFIQINGTSLENARLNYILHGEIPAPGDLQSFLNLQNTEGGFPFGFVQGNLSALDNTLTALWWLDELGLLDSPQAGRSLDYLLAVQREDGSWDEDLVLARYDLPPWISPGTLNTRMYLSAYATYWLLLAGFQGHPALAKALAFLQEHQKASGKFDGPLHVTWIGAAAFVLAGRAYREIADRAMNVLIKIPANKWVDSQLAWALDCMSHAGLPKDHPFVAQSLVGLIQRQDSLGRWASEDGDAFAVGATLQVLRALKHYGVLR